MFAKVKLQGDDVHRLQQVSASDDVHTTSSDHAFYENNDNDYDEDNVM